MNSEIFSIYINDQSTCFHVANEKVAKELCDLMNKRNKALEPLRAMGKEYTKDLLTTHNRLWTYRKTYIWQSLKEILEECPLTVEPEEAL